MYGSFLFRSFIFCWLCLLACPVFGEPQEVFLEIQIDPSVIRLKAELAYSGAEDQASLEEAAKREIGKLFTVSASQDLALSGQLKEAKIGPGARREELSGEVITELPKQKNLNAVWEFPYSSRSDRLTFRSQIEKPVSFVTYHLGVRLHDVAPFKTEQVLRLDGEDPWYSHFVQPELARTPQESIACYLYLEPGQTRFEVLARARDLQPLGKLDLGSDSEISIAKQEGVSKEVGEILKKRLEVWVNDRPLELRLEKVQFVKRTATSADAMEKAEPVPVHLATLGAILLGPAITEEGALKLRCQLFGPRVRQIPLYLIRGDQQSEVKLLPDQDGMVKLEAPPEGPALSPVSAPESTAQGIILSVAVVVLALGAFLMYRAPNGSGTFLVGMVLWILAGAGAVKWVLLPDKTDLKTPLQSLLGNIYQAFEAPTEEAIYDQLAVSVEGELLSEVYLQTRKGLEAEQGVQVVVEQVKIKSATVSSANWWGEGMSIRAMWEVSGRVGHWGHEHQRANWYTANLKLKSVDGNWKLTDLEILDEIRI